jgi:DNA (cytosine-5)-methyltransferase 1
MTLGSLFDGIGGFPLAGVMCGIAPVWASEIEPFPVKVTAARFPDMKQLGDVTKINGAEIEPVDIITFGSPCQDLSVAGKQKGIHDGERSNLFFEAIRIIKEMRDATARANVDVRPKYAVWENVPGAFSSNGGEDFRAVLEAFASVCEDGLSIPRPKKWNHAGCVAGHGWSVAWRVYDAQYWGVPQRRKRIYLIADFASERAGEILFEREGLRGDSAESGAAGQGTAADAEGGVGRSCFNESGKGYWMPGFGCLRAEGENRPSRPTHTIVEPAAFMGGQGAKARSIAYCDDGTTPTLKASPSGGNTVPDVCYRPGGFGGMTEGVGTLRANGGDAGGGTESIIVERVHETQESTGQE